MGPRNRRSVMFWACVLAAGLWGAISGTSPGAARAQGVTVALSVDPDPGTLAIDDPDAVPESKTVARAEALHERFGSFHGEDQKQALLAEASRQSTIYSAQWPGGTASLQTPRWRSLGPTTARQQGFSDSGRIRRVLQDPGAPDIVYVLSSGGGLWKTQTFSHAKPDWIPLTDNLMSTSGGNFAFGRSSRTLYLGVGDPFDKVPTVSGVMVKSTDGGATWSAFRNLSGSFSVRDVAVDTSAAADVVLVAADGGVYRSADAGESYELVLSAAVAPSCPLRFAFSSNTEVAAGFWSLARTAAGWLASACDGRLYRSSDRGAAWAEVAAFPGGGRSTLAVARPGDPVVYAFAANLLGDSQLDLFRSLDGGLSWVALGVTAQTPANPKSAQPTMNLMGAQAWYNQMILIDPSNPNVIYLGGRVASAKSADGGSSWRVLSTGGQSIGIADAGDLPYVHHDYHAATMITLSGQPAIVFGTDGGMFVSSDGGMSFDVEKNDGLVTMLTQTVMSSSKTPQSVISGTQDTGTRARLGASSAFNSVTPGDGEGVGWSQANNAVTMSTFQGGFVFRSNGLLPNTFGAWQFVPPPRFAGDAQLFFTPMATPSAATDPTGLVFLTASARRIFVTFDGARTSGSWLVLARAGSRLPADFVVRSDYHILALEAADPQFNRVAVGGGGGRIAYTLDGGASFGVTNLIGAVPGFTGFISSPAWTRSGGLYVASESPDAGSVRVVKSFDSGASWQRADFGLPDAPVFHIVVDPRDPSGRSIFAGTSFGVYHTTNGGESWSLFGAGLPAVTVAGLWIAPDGSLLRAATYGRGLWEVNPK